MDTASIVVDVEDCDTRETTTLTTTLYDFIAAVQDAIEPGEEALVVPIVTRVLRAAGATWQTPSTLALP